MQNFECLKFLEYLLKKQIYIKIFAKQKHVEPLPDLLKISTKEFYEREKAQHGEVMITGKDVLNNVSLIKICIYT